MTSSHKTNKTVVHSFKFILDYNDLNNEYKKHNKHFSSTQSFGILSRISLFSFVDIKSRILGHHKRAD